MSYAWNSLSFQQKRAEGGAVAIFAISLLFVFLILAALYESWSLPFSVLLGTPVAVNSDRHFLGAGALCRH